MALSKMAGKPLALLILAAVTGVVLITLFIVKNGNRQAVLSSIDQGIVSKSSSDSVKAKSGRTPKKRHKPGDRYIVIDTHANHVYLRTENKILLDAVCSTGSGDTLLDTATGRLWVFNTPKGEFEVESKLVEPWWRKPDWAFIEEGTKPPPPSKDQERLDPAMMGDYAIGFGDGFFIHGTLYERLLGVNVTHGCVRLGSEDLQDLYKQVSIGTTVYVF